MPVDPEFQIKLLRGGDSVKPERKITRIAKRKRPTKAEVFRAFHATPGAKELVAEAPGLAVVSKWGEIAHFSVCEKRGTATFLDIWDNDHFDGFTDMKRCLTGAFCFLVLTVYQIS